MAPFTLFVLRLYIQLENYAQLLRGDLNGMHIQVIIVFPLYLFSYGNLWHSPATRIDFSAASGNRKIFRMSYVRKDVTHTHTHIAKLEGYCE